MCFSLKMEYVFSVVCLFRLGAQLASSTNMAQEDHSCNSASNPFNHVVLFHFSKLDVQMD